MIKIKIPQVQQQNNGHECGLFAISNMMEFVTCRYDGLREQRLGFSFNQSDSCKHFVKCLEQNYMEPIQKISLNSPKTLLLLPLRWIFSVVATSQMFQV